MPERVTLLDSLLLTEEAKGKPHSPSFANRHLQYADGFTEHTR